MGRKRGVKFRNSGQFTASNQYQHGRYTGGAVKGHLSTNDKGNPEHSVFTPGNPWAIGGPLHSPNHRAGGRPKSKERRCMEEIQAGRLEVELLERYPERMVKRLMVLADLSEDKDHRDCLKAQQMMREILETRRGEAGESSDKPEQATITLLRGHVDVPMPGVQREAAPPEALGEAARADRS